MRNVRVLWLACALLVAVQGCWFDDELKHDTGTVPDELDDGWQTATPKSVGLSDQDLDEIHQKLLDENYRRGVLSLLVVKDGKLVFETYARSRGDQIAAAPIQSVTKSVTSLLVGIASDQGLIPSLDVTLGDLFPDELEGLASEKRNITLKHLLTMRSGLQFDNQDFYGEMWVEPPSNPVRYMLEKPLYADPGERYYYRDVDPQLLGYAFTKMVGVNEQEFAEENLFGPLGIRDAFWEQGPDGVNIGGAGLLLSPRDLARLGQLALDGGIWEDQRIVSSAWLSAATTRQVDTDVAYNQSVFGYGYYFWVIPEVGFSAVGHGGQYILVVPERKMVLIQTSFPYGDLPGSHLTDFLDLVNPIL